jgi:hypothetical protein
MGGFGANWGREAASARREQEAEMCREAMESGV